jgi:hypothetical protein
METLTMPVLALEELAQHTTLPLSEPLLTDKLQALEVILVVQKATKRQDHTPKQTVDLPSAVETLCHKTV